MPYSFASSTGSAHGTLDGLDDLSSILSIAPEDESTRNDIRLRDTAKAYKFWGGNRKPSVNVNSSYIANAFPDFSQGISTSGSDHSVETGRAATRRSQQGPVSVEVSARPPARSSQRTPPNDVQKSRVEDTPTVSEPIPTFSKRNSTPPNGGSTEFRPASIRPSPRSPVMSPGRFSSPLRGSSPQNNGSAQVHRAMSSESQASESQSTHQEAVSSTRRISHGAASPPRPTSSAFSKATAVNIPPALRYTLDPDYVPPHKWGMPGTNTTATGQKIDPHNDKPAFFKKPEAPATSRTSQEQPGTFVSGASWMETNSQRRTPSEMHARVADETEASFLDEQPTVTTTSRSRFQGVAPVTSASFVSHNQHKMPFTSSKSTVRANSAAIHDNFNVNLATVFGSADDRDLNTLSHKATIPALDSYDSFNATTKSFSMPEMPDISKILAPTYNNSTVNSRFSKALDPFLKTRQISNNAATHGSISGIAVPLDEKDLYLAIQALQAQVTQLKNEKDQKEQIYAAAQHQIETLEAEVASADQRSSDLQQELRMHKTCLAQIEALRNELASANLRNSELAQQLTSVRAETSRYESESRNKIDELQYVVSSAERQRISLEAEIRTVRDEMKTCKDTESTCRTQVKDLQAETYRAYARVSALEELIAGFKEEKSRREDSDSAFGDEEKSEVNTLKHQLTQSAKEVDNAYKQLHTAASTIDTLQKEYVKLRQQFDQQGHLKPSQETAQQTHKQAVQQPLESVEQNNVLNPDKAQDEDQYEDELTLRPCQPPSVALRSVIDRLEKELVDEKLRLTEATREYNEQIAGYRGRSRRSLKERVEWLVVSVDAKAEVIYDLHDVLEADI